MYTQIKFAPASINDADALFERDYRFSLEFFLRTECVLDPEGVERVIREARHIFIRTCYSIDCKLLLPMEQQPPFKEHSATILSYVQAVGPGMCNAFVDTIKRMRYTMLEEACRQLAHLDEKTVNRKKH